MDRVTKYTRINHNLTNGFKGELYLISTSFVQHSFDKLFHTINICLNDVVQNNLLDSQSNSTWYSFCSFDHQFGHAKYHLMNEKYLLKIYNIC